MNLNLITSIKPSDFLKHFAKSHSHRNSILVSSSLWPSGVNIPMPNLKDKKLDMTKEVREQAKRLNIEPYEFDFLLSKITTTDNEILFHSIKKFMTEFKIIYSQELSDYMQKIHKLEKEEADRLEKQREQQILYITQLKQSEQTKKREFLQKYLTDLHSRYSQGVSIYSKSELKQDAHLKSVLAKHTNITFEKKGFWIFARYYVNGEILRVSEVSDDFFDRIYNDFTLTKYNESN